MLLKMGETIVLEEFTAEELAAMNRPQIMLELCDEDAAEKRGGSRNSTLRQRVQHGWKSWPCSKRMSHGSPDLTNRTSRKWPRRSTTRSGKSAARCENAEIRGAGRAAAVFSVF